MNTPDWKFMLCFKFLNFSQHIPSVPLHCRQRLKNDLMLFPSSSSSPPLPSSFVFVVLAIELRALSLLGSTLSVDQYSQSYFSVSFVFGVFLQLSFFKNSALLPRASRESSVICSSHET
jgi:hypothetical protein